MLPWLAFSFFLLIDASTFHEDFLQPPRSTCYSCANFAYLTIWHKLMEHYFPPKNFTDECWHPANSNEKIDTVPCTTACFTLVERIDQYDYPIAPDYSGVFRGCVDRLLLFGVDDDVREALRDHNRVCRQTDRKILRLHPLSVDSPIVTFCSCTGERCNDQEMLNGILSSNLYGLLLFVTLLVFL